MKISVKALDIQVGELFEYAPEGEGEKEDSPMAKLIKNIWSN